MRNGVAVTHWGLPCFWRHKRLPFSRDWSSNRCAEPEIAAPQEQELDAIRHTPEVSPFRSNGRPSGAQIGEPAEEKEHAKSLSGHAANTTMLLRKGARS